MHLCDMPTLTAERFIPAYGQGRYASASTIVKTDIGVPAVPAEGLVSVRSRWDQVINDNLIEWGRQPEALADDGIPPPTHESLAKAFELAIQLRDGGLPAPDYVAGNGDGGIVFSRRVGTVFEQADITDKGEVEILFFSDGKLESRLRL